MGNGEITDDLDPILGEVYHVLWKGVTFQSEARPVLDNKLIQLEMFRRLAKIPTPNHGLHLLLARIWTPDLDPTPPCFLVLEQGMAHEASANAVAEDASTLCPTAILHRLPSTQRPRTVTEVQLQVRHFPAATPTGLQESYNIKSQESYKSNERGVGGRSRQYGLLQMQLLVCLEPPASLGGDMKLIFTGTRGESPPSGVRCPLPSGEPGDS